MSSYAKNCVSTSRMPKNLAVSTPKKSLKICIFSSFCLRMMMIWYSEMEIFHVTILKKANTFQPLYHGGRPKKISVLLGVDSYQIWCNIVRNASRVEKHWTNAPDQPFSQRAWADKNRVYQVSQSIWWGTKASAWSAGTSNLLYWRWLKCRSYISFMESVTFVLSKVSYSVRIHFIIKSLERPRLTFRTSKFQ